MSFRALTRTLAALLALPLSAAALQAQATGQPAAAKQEQALTPPKALVIIDEIVIGRGLRLHAEDLDALNVASLEIMKGAEAVRLYGDSAAAGVVVIRTHAGIDAKMADRIRVQSATPSWAALRVPAGRLDVMSGSPRVMQPVMIIDGILVGTMKLDWLEPDQIESINVFKGEAAARYGEDARSGVLMIRTKEGARTVRRNDHGGGKP